MRPLNRQISTKLKETNKQTNNNNKKTARAPESHLAHSYVARNL